MSLGTDLTFIEKYHRAIIEVLAACVLVFGVFWIKDKYKAIEIAAKDKIIAQLDTDYKVLLAQKTVSDQAIVEKTSEYDKIHAELIALLSKKPVVIQSPAAPLPHLPNISTFSSLDDCNRTVQSLQVDNNACVDTVNSLQEGKKVDTAIIGNLTDKVVAVDKENTEVKKDLDSETSRKKAWRWGAVIGWVVAIGKFLI